MRLSVGAPAEPDNLVAAISRARVPGLGRPAELLERRRQHSRRGALRDPESPCDLVLRQIVCVAELDGLLLARAASARRAALRGGHGVRTPRTPPRPPGSDAARPRAAAPEPRSPRGPRSPRAPTRLLRPPPPRAKARDPAPARRGSPGRGSSRRGPARVEARGSWPTGRAGGGGARRRSSAPRRPRTECRGSHRSGAPLRRVRRPRPGRGRRAATPGRCTCGRATSPATDGRPPDRAQDRPRLPHDDLAPPKRKVQEINATFA